MNVSKTDHLIQLQIGDHREVPKSDQALYLSMVVPIYNESDTIRPIIMQLVQILRETDLTFEIIAVDDGSNDDTQTVIQALFEQFPDYLRVMIHPYNKGNGAAIKTGVRVARGEIIACMDADGQHDAHDLLRMLPYMTEYDLVVGARTGAYQGAWHRNLANKFYNALASWLAEFPIEDLTSGYRLFRTSVLKQYISLFPARFSYPTTSTLIFLKGGYNVKYVPIRVKPRQGGASKIKIVNDGWRFLVIIFKIIVLFEPLRLFLPVAMLSFILAILSTAYATWYIQTLRIPNSSVILFVLGVLVILLGLISEQIAAMQISLLQNETD